VSSVYVGQCSACVERLADGLTRDPNSVISEFASQIQTLDRCRIAGKWTVWLSLIISLYLTALQLFPRLLELGEDDATKDQPIGEPEGSPKKRTKRAAKVKNADKPTH
jgi:hypothetical protein